MENQIYKWRCPLCGKEVQSLYEGQFKFNVKNHKMTHEKEVLNNGKLER